LEIIRNQFCEVLLAHNDLYTSTVIPYNGAASPVKAVVNMGPLKPPQRNRVAKRTQHVVLNNAVQIYDLSYIHLQCPLLLRSFGRGFTCLSSKVACLFLRVSFCFNGIPAPTLIHHNLPQVTLCIAKTAWSITVLD